MPISAYPDIVLVLYRQRFHRDRRARIGRDIGDVAAKKEMENREYLTTAATSSPLFLDPADAAELSE